MNLVYDVTGAVKRKKKNKRGVVTNKALDKIVAASGVIKIQFGSNGRPVDSELGNKYARAVGGTIRDKLPMLWSTWKRVPDTVKETLRLAMTVSLSNLSIILCIK